MRGRSLAGRVSAGLEESEEVREAKMREELAGLESVG